MIEQDRRLLARAAQLNADFGRAVSDLMAHQHDGQLPADALRAIGRSLGELAAAFLARESELDGHPAPARVVIDAHTE
ncbi:hypothetical protein GCM10009676_15470 [Prauserella halophila]|uniref:Uncharacterized protein n=1 Tax=Prauserella halophila TaxID=185641 RepID=A0ABN1W2Z9_9PSEU|nr:hypothetical protein [Prauserella halophila]MCP2236246.1 hypothetical protein [Prauserella halophila]